MWDPPWPGLEPVSPALAGGFVTTAPPEAPRKVNLMAACNNRAEAGRNTRQGKSLEGYCRNLDMRWGGAKDTSAMGMKHRGWTKGTQL